MYRPTAHKVCYFVRFFASESTIYLFRMDLCAINELAATQLIRHEILFIC